MFFDCPSAVIGGEGSFNVRIRLLIDYISRINKAREICCDFGKAVQSDQAGVAAAIDCDCSFRLGHGVICGIVGETTAKPLVVEPLLF